MDILRRLKFTTFEFLLLECPDNYVRGPQIWHVFSFPGEMMASHAPGSVAKSFHLHYFPVSTEQY